MMTSSVEISWLAIVKILDGQDVHRAKLKKSRNCALFDIVNASKKDIRFGMCIILGMVDFHSLGCYGTSLGVLQKNLSKAYQFESPIL